MGKRTKHNNRIGKTTDLRTDVAGRPGQDAGGVGVERAVVAALALEALETGKAFDTDAAAVTAAAGVGVGVDVDVSAGTGAGSVLRVLRDGRVVARVERRRTRRTQLVAAVVDVTIVFFVVAGVRRREAQSP